MTGNWTANVGLNAMAGSASRRRWFLTTYKPIRHLKRKAGPIWAGFFIHGVGEVGGGRTFESRLNAFLVTGGLSICWDWVCAEGGWPGACTLLNGSAP